MNILIFEYITGGGMVGQELPLSLVKEGKMMLASVASDLDELPNTNIYTLRDYRLNANSVSNNDIVIGPKDSYIEKIEEITLQIDALLIIAPETDDVLTSLCSIFSGRKFVLLNSTIESIKLTTSKLDTYNYFQKHDIPQIPTYLSSQLENIPAEKYVIKPNKGAGCDKLFLSSNRDEIEDKILNHSDEQFICQPFISGRHASVSLICWYDDCILLSCNKQNLIEENKALRLKACTVNALDRKTVDVFCKKIVKALPEFRGYIGIDILITDEEILLVEINPRLTTSYVGIKTALGVNPAELMLYCFLNNELPTLEAAQNNKIKIDIETCRAA